MPTMTQRRMTQRLADLRAELKARDLDGFLVPKADEHQGEYVPPHAERLAWLTGFTGSAGIAAVLAEKAAVFVDGRYTLQVRDQVDGALFDFRHVSDAPLGDWLLETLSDGASVGYDPWLHSKSGIARLTSKLSKAGISLVPVDGNPLDKVWQDQPPRPVAPVEIHPMKYAGQTAEEKRLELADGLTQQSADAVVLTLPDSIAWLLNIRGADVPCTPFALSFAIVHQDGRVDWFIDQKKLDAGDPAALAAHLGNGVMVRPPESLEGDLAKLSGRTVLVDPASAPIRVSQVLDEAGATIKAGADPCQILKARKNPTELDGTRAAHRRDGAALSRFLAWIERQAPARAGQNPVRELEAVETLAAFRREDPLLRDFSFDTISGSGPNGAIVHYRVTPETDRALGLGELFLCDSGGQYLDGTTDVTRTLPIGEPDEEMRERFTLVLKGHIALATARFPHGTSGSQLDTLARMPLWQAGLDYDHGTGHGVGSYLSVHEGPQRISKLPNTVALEPGMIVSNEPGYYKTGAYGIRIENLVAVVESAKQDGEERDMLAFETLTLAPISRRLIKSDLLSAEEIAWLDAYHARVRETHEGVLQGADKDWLLESTAPLANNEA